MSEDILEKIANDPGNVRAESKGGYLTAPQANTFIEYTWDATVLGGQVRTEKIRGESAELNRIGVGERLLRVATEAVDDGVNVGPAFGKVSLSTTKFRLDWEISTEALEDGTTGDALKDIIMRQMAGQVATDLEDYAINASLDKTDDPGLKAFDGWDTLGLKRGHVVDAAGGSLDRKLVSSMIKALPRREKKNRGSLKVFAGSNAVQDYLDSEYDLRLAAEQLGTSSNDHVGGDAGFTAQPAHGVKVQEVPLFEDERVGTYTGAGASDAVHSNVWLTDPKNLIWVLQREVSVYKEFVPRKDTTEYTLYVRGGCNIENGNGFVVATNVRTDG